MTTSTTPNTELREALELFRKQCINKGGGIGFEEAVARLETLITQAERRGELKGRIATIGTLIEQLAFEDIPLTDEQFKSVKAWQAQLRTQQGESSNE